MKDHFLLCLCALNFIYHLLSLSHSVLGDYSRYFHNYQSCYLIIWLFMENVDLNKDFYEALLTKALISLRLFIEK